MHIINPLTQIKVVFLEVYVKSFLLLLGWFFGIKLHPAACIFLLFVCLFVLFFLIHPVGLTLYVDI